MTRSVKDAADQDPHTLSFTAGPPALALGMSNASAIGRKRHFGEVAVWNARLGWGFIRREDFGPDIFVHQRSIARSRSSFRSLLEGERVEFSERHATQEGSSKRGRSRRLEAVEVTGPNMRPVIGQSPQMAAAGEAPYFAVETVSPNALSLQGGASTAAGTCGDGNNTASGDVPRVRRPTTSFVPRAVARAACASQPLNRVPNRSSQKPAASTASVATEHNAEANARTDERGGTNGATQGSSGRELGEADAIEPAYGDEAVSMPSGTPTNTRKSSRKRKDGGVTKTSLATTEADGKSVGGSAAASVNGSAADSARSIKPQHMKNCPEAQPTASNREKKARHSMPA
uniref:CSD domain-containing protein n=1 Tax=Chrysotila carterae TaxID=13221 RepID=A0A7S4FCE3_CHRCT